MDKQLENSIIKTLAYFDYFDHPLTKEELFRFLWQPPKISYVSFLHELFNYDFESSKFLNSKNGFYFLKNREDTVLVRQEKTADNDYKHKVARKAVKKIRYVPFVHAVLVCNNTSFEMASKKSDIDVVIIARAGRIWIARLLVTLLLSIWRLRRNKKKTVNRICLSFYTTNKSLDFSKLVITQPDIGFMYWIMQFCSIYDPDNLQQLILQKNKWIKPYLPNAFRQASMSERFFVKDNLISKTWKGFWHLAWKGKYGDLVEDQTRSIQKAKMRRNLHSVQDEPDTRVIISDQVLKFHEKDRRVDYKKEWEEKINKINNNLSKF